MGEHGRIFLLLVISGFTRSFEMFSLEEKDELVAFVANLRAEIMISPPEDQLELLPNGLLRLGTSLSAELAAAASYHHLHLRHPIDLSQPIMTFCLPIVSCSMACCRSRPGHGLGTDMNR